MNFVSRFGVLAKKVGMTRVLDQNKAVAVTLLEIPKCHVLKKDERDGYVSISLGVEKCDKKIRNPQVKEFEKKNLPVCPMTREFRVTKEEADSIADFVQFDWVEEGNFVDVTGKTVGKGFAGPMKRWNFSGLRASHGVSLTHRSHGSTGTRDKIFKNRKMAGHLGNEQVTIQSQKVVKIDENLGIIAVSGCVPGRKGSWVRMTKAIKGFGEK